MNDLIEVNNSNSLVLEDLYKSPVFWQNVKNTVAKGLEDHEFKMFMVVAQSKRLNPLDKEIYAWATGSGDSRKLNIMVGGHGALKIARTHADFKDFICSEIRENDIFEFNPVTKELIKHVPNGLINEQISDIQFEIDMILSKMEELREEKTPEAKKELNELSMEFLKKRNEKRGKQKEAIKGSAVVGAYALSKRHSVPDELQVCYLDEFIKKDKDGKITEVWRNYTADMIKLKSISRVIKAHYKDDLEGVNIDDGCINVEYKTQNAGEKVSPSVYLANPEDMFPDVI